MPMSILQPSLGLVFGVDRLHL